MTVIVVESALELVIVVCVVCIQDQDTQMSLNPSEMFVTMAVASY